MVPLSANVTVLITDAVMSEIGSMCIENEVTLHFVVFEVSKIVIEYKLTVGILSRVEVLISTCMT